MKINLDNWYKPKIDKKSKRYVFCPEGPAEYGPEFGEG